MSELAVAYHHIMHPHTHEVVNGLAKPTKTVEHVFAGKKGLSRINAHVGLIITVAVGTMWCAYIFAAIALVSLPEAISSHSRVIIVAWISSNFLQLVLLPIIIVGQNIQAKAADARAEDTYKDAEAVLHEALEIQKHLASQDQAIGDILARLRPQPTA